MDKRSLTHSAKKPLDIALTALLLAAMSYQVTGEVLHEWLGLIMVGALVIHHILNRKWYAALPKGRYSPLRVTMTAVNTLLLISLLLTAVSGIAMSVHALPFLRGIIKMITARRLHIAMSYQSFLLMGVHIGLHLTAVRSRLNVVGRIAFDMIFTAASGVGLWLCIKNSIFDYMFFKTHFAFLDYSKPQVIVLLENLAILCFFTFFGCTIAKIFKKNKDGKISLKPALWFAAAVALGIILSLAGGQEEDKNGFGGGNGMQWGKAAMVRHL